MKKGLGWIRDSKDSRDLYCLLKPPLAPLPKEIDLRSLCPPVLDQGDLGSCVENSVLSVVQFDEFKQKLPYEGLYSRLFLYFNVRRMEGTIDSDAGGMIRDAIKSVYKDGVCPEELWPYDDGPTQFKVQPPKSCYDAAKKHKALSYQRVPRTELAIKQILASGYPISFGITVFSSFMSQDAAQSGNIPLPQPGDQIEGGHAIALVGYKDSTRQFIFRNSWGEIWAEKGYGYLPYEYVLSELASDFWVIKVVT